MQVVVVFLILVIIYILQSVVSDNDEYEIIGRTIMYSCYKQYCLCLGKIPANNDHEHNVEKFVDRKLDKAETLLKKKERKAKMWFNKITNNDDDIIFHEIHVFMASFLAGITMGIIFGKLL